MDQLNLNTARAILVAGAVLALLFALAARLWTTVVVLAVGITAHALLWWYLRRSRADDDAQRREPEPL